MLNSDFTTSSTRSDKIESFSEAQVEGTCKEQALFDAIVAHDRTAIKALLAQPGIDLSQHNQDGQTLLHAAAHEGDAETVADLIRYYKDDKAVLRCNGDDWQARIADAQKNKHPMREINDFRFLDAKDSKGFSALMVTAQKGHLAALQVLIDADADLCDEVIPISVAKGAIKPTNGPHPQRSLVGKPPNQRYIRITSALIYNDPNLPYSKHGYSALMLAAENDQPLAIKQLLDACAKKSSRTKSRYLSHIGGAKNALMVAAHEGHLSSAKALMNAGARTEGDELVIQSTPLATAAKHDDVDMIHCLLDNGAALDFKPTSSYSALANAARSGATRAVAALCARGANTEAKCFNGQRPLHYAAAHGHAAAIEILLGFRANINAVDADGKTPLMHAMEKAHPAAITALIRLGALDELTPDDKQKALRRAVEFDAAVLILALAESGIALDVADDAGRTPLFVAAQYGRLAALEALLQSGANTLARDRAGLTPIAIAAKLNRPEAIRIFYANQANLEARTAQAPLPANAPLSQPHLSGKTPLLIAAEAGHLASVATLVELGADIDARDHHGATALTLATERRRIDVIEWLVKKGANLELRNADKNTPFMIAAKHRDHDLMVRLRAAGANINAVDINAGPSAGNSPLLTAIETGDMENLMLLLQLQADINQENAAGFSPLRVAIEYNRPEMIHALIVSGANIDAADRNGTTPFMAASRLNQVDTMRWLAQANANTRATNAGGQDARTLAIRAGAREAQDFLTKELGWIAPATRAPGQAL